MWLFHSSLHVTVLVVYLLNCNCFWGLNTCSAGDNSALARRRYLDFANLFIHPYITLDAVSEEECEAHSCTISSSKLKTVEWVQCTRWFYLNCLETINSDSRCCLRAETVVTRTETACILWLITAFLIDLVNHKLICNLSAKCSIVLLRLKYNCVG